MTEQEFGNIAREHNGRLKALARRFIRAADMAIDGKKCAKEALTKIKPESIASMTVYKAGCKEAVELSGRKDVAVIKVVTK